MSPVFLSDSVWLTFGTTSVSTGAATNADSTPTVTILEDGVALGYAPTVTNITTGLYQVQIDATAANGFEAGRRYAVYAVATVGAVTGRDGIGEFEVLAVDLNTGVASVTGAVASVTAGVTLAAAAVQAIWDALTTALTTAGSIGKRLADNINAAIDSRMATYTQPTGFLAATFPGTVASTTNITAGTITTTTNLTNLPTIPANWLTAAGIAAAALNGKGDWNIGKTGYSLTQAFPTNFSSLTITIGGAVTAGTVSDKTGYALTQTFPTNFSALSITATGLTDGNVKSVNNVTVNGVGTAGNPWSP